MFPLVEFPELAQHYAPHFESVFSSAAFVEFERYVSGLIVPENKTVDGINRLVWQAAGITRIRRHRWPVEVY
jgi:hypothetical protein